MATSQGKRVIDHLRRAALAGEGAGLSDGQLLTCFIEHRDEVAFEALVRRHGPMVLGVCRRVLRSPSDAEDAFQATFLVLVRKVASIQSRETVANWLYGVAYNVALKARAINARRGGRERQVEQMPEPKATRPEGVWQDLLPLLDQELNRLPDKYRLPIVLCDLEGKSRKDAAQQLHLPEGTLSSRLTRARAKLAGRLARRGLVLSAAALGAALAQEAASANPPASLVSSTVNSAMIFLVDPAATGGAISASVAALAEGALKAMLLRKMKLAILGVLTAGFVFTGAIVSTQALTPRQKPETETVPAVKPKQAPQTVQGQPPKERADSAPPKKESKVQALLKERLKILRARADMLRKLHQNAQASYEVVQQADLRVYKAELDLCATDKERIAVQEKIVGVYKEIEELLRRLQRSAAVSSDIIADATVNRLEAEIELERLREKANPPAK